MLLDNRYNFHVSPNRISLDSLLPQLHITHCLASHLITQYSSSLHGFLTLLKIAYNLPDPQVLEVLGLLGHRHLLNRAGLQEERLRGPGQVLRRPPGLDLVPSPRHPLPPWTRRHRHWRHRGADFQEEARREFTSICRHEYTNYIRPDKRNRTTLQ